MAESTQVAGPFSQTLVRMHKYDNQAAQYKLFRNIWVDTNKLSEFVKKLKPGTPGFYWYEYGPHGSLNHYSINPDVFESIEVPQIHMT